MIEVERVTVTYGKTTDSAPISDLTLSIASGSLAIMGPSGSGKSTLLRVIAGLQAPDTGSVRIDQVEVVRPSRTRAGDPRVALVHQDYRLVPFLTVRENLELAMELRSLPPDGNSVAPALAQVGLAGFQDRSPITLSGGEQQRVAIARALVTRATVLLADEPTGALDARNSAAVAEIFGRLGRLPGMTVLVATHDRDVACAFPSVGHLKDGHLTVEPTTHVTT